ncbi:MAG: crossover junction endodeoxyribonuclease RuvC [Candidatus Colwellbacteria bacterium]|nr:crossover junction endodeoxyribonuclease RuvC [Candidatus Colwellbacteria bacterium]
MREFVILGLDPGTHRTGYGVVRFRGGAREAIAHGVIEPVASNTPERLAFLEREALKLIRRHAPDRLAIERLYFSKNQKTALSVAEARGALLLAGHKGKVPVIELDPTVVKQRVTGYGHADKRSVLKLIRLIFVMKDFSPLDDASDALAIALAAEGEAFLAGPASSSRAGSPGH